MISPLIWCSEDEGLMVNWYVLLSWKTQIEIYYLYEICDGYTRIVGIYYMVSYLEGINMNLLRVGEETLGPPFKQTS